MRLRVGPDGGWGVISSGWGANLMIILADNFYHSIVDSGFINIIKMVQKNQVTKMIKLLNFL